jgi:hypothetical protein
VSAGKGSQVFLPGAHSDIGGGYVNGKGENKALWTGSGSKQLIDFLETYGWATDAETHLVGTFDIRERLGDVRPMLPDNTERKLKPLQAHLLMRDPYVKLQRPQISNRYSYIPLRLMAEFAREQGLNIVSKLEDTYNPKKGPMPMPPNMIDKIMSYARRAKTTRDSLAEDWYRHTPDLNSLRNKFLHFSSSSDAGLNLRANLWEDFLDPWRRVYSDNA